MPSRRHFLKSAAVISASPLAGRIVFADGAEPAALDALVVDTRHHDARAFALRAARWSAPVREIGGDITELWQRELRVRWQGGAAAVAVAGLTERPALFLLERLAWDYGLRVVFEAEHETAGEGSAAHRVVRSARADLKGRLEAAGPMWAAVLADSLLAGASGLASRDFRPTEAAMASSLDEPTRLHSWIIAPRPAAWRAKKES